MVGVETGWEPSFRVVARAFGGQPAPDQAHITAVVPKTDGDPRGSSFARTQLLCIPHHVFFRDRRAAFSRVSIGNNAHALHPQEHKIYA
jgi:hypothetical protein